VDDKLTAKPAQAAPGVVDGEVLQRCGIRSAPQRVGEGGVAVDEAGSDRRKGAQSNEIDHDGHPARTLRALQPHRWILTVWWRVLLDPGLLSRLIGRALQKGADFAEVYVQRRKSLGFSLDDGVVRDATSGRDYGVGIRVLRGASMSYSWSDDTSDEALLACADAASRIDGASGSPTIIARPLSHRARATWADPSRPPADVPLDRRATLVRRLDEAARSAIVREGAHLVQVACSYADVDEDILIANSEGLLVADRRALVRLNVEVVIDDKGERRSGTGGGGSRIGLDHYDDPHTSPEACAEEAVRMACAQRGARAAPRGEGTVVLGPSSSGVLLHEAVGHGLEADFIRKKTSLFTGRLGEKVASELCTVVDDGTLPGKRGSLNVDDEGQITSRTTLIERGILTGYLTDRLNAGLLGMERTGNGRRQSFRHPPMPRMTNTFLAKGTDDPADVIAAVKNGLYCRAFGGGQVDIANGSFVFEVKEGYLIEDGKLTAPVRGATLVGNGPETLSRITRVGHDAELDPGVYTCGKEGQSVPVGVGLPTIRIDGITIGGTG
jgi:TldD protein